MASSLGTDKFMQVTPDVPFFTIKVEDRIYDIDINYLEEFTYQRKSNDFGEFTFSMVNVADLNLEDKFLALFEKYTECPPISLQYGWVKSGKTPWYRGILRNFTPTWRSGGYVDIEVSGEVVSLEATTRDVSSYRGNSISDIVAAIAADYGWTVVEIEQTQSFSEERVFRLSNISPIDYIRKELEPYAVNENNEPMVFYCELGDAGETKIYFVSINKGTAVQKNYNFYVNMGNYGNVLSWSASYEGNLIAGSLESAAIDLDTNDICVYGKEAANVKRTSGSLLTVYGSTTHDKMAPLLNNKWYQSNIGAQKGTLKIIGDPTIQLLQKVNVCPMTPKGDFHRFLGGTFTVESITDTIAGSYTTSLELVRADAGGTTMLLEEAINFTEKGKQ